jgi:hypothetical protein
MRRRNELALLPKLPLLITESADEFDALRDAFEREIKPRGIIEQMYVHDISAIVWEILRLRRCKVIIINSAFRSALENLLVQLRQPGQQEFQARDPARELAHAWFTDKEAQKQVSETLSRFDLDESAIEAEASGSRPLTSSCSTGCWPRWRHVATRRLGALPNIVPAWRTNCGRARIGSLTARTFFVSKMQPASAQRRPDHGERTTNCRQPPQRAQEHRPPFRRG